MIATLLAVAVNGAGKERNSWTNRRKWREAARRREQTERDGGIRSIVVPRDGTVADLRNAPDDAGVNQAEHEPFSVGGEELEDDQALLSDAAGESAVDDGSSESEDVQLDRLLVPRGSGLQLLVSSGFFDAVHLIVVPVDPSRRATVADLRKAAVDARIDEAQQGRLFIGRRELADGQTLLCNSGVYAGSIVHIVTGGPRGIPQVLYVTAQGAEGILRIDVTTDATVADLREAAANSGSIDSKQNIGHYPLETRIYPMTKCHWRMLESVPNLCCISVVREFIL